MFEQPKTKEMVQVLKNLNVDKKALIVTEDDKNVILSARNIPGVLTSSANTLNVVDILKHDYIIFSKAAVQKTEEVLGNA